VAVLRLNSAARCSGSRPDDERFLQDAVAADLLELDTAQQQVPAQVVVADRRGAGRGDRGDQHVPIRGVRPVGLPLLQPLAQRPVHELAEPLRVTSQRDASTGQQTAASTASTNLHDQYRCMTRKSCHAYAR
jgi:hypothetical protein